MFYNIKFLQINLKMWSSPNRKFNQRNSWLNWCVDKLRKIVFVQQQNHSNFWSNWSIDAFRRTQFKWQSLNYFAQRNWMLFFHGSMHSFLWFHFKFSEQFRFLILVVVSSKIFLKNSLIKLDYKNSILPRNFPLKSSRNNLFFFFVTEISWIHCLSILDVWHDWQVSICLIIAWQICHYPWVFASICSELEAFLWNEIPSVTPKWWNDIKLVQIIWSVPTICWFSTNFLHF